MKRRKLHLAPFGFMRQFAPPRKGKGRKPKMPKPPMMMLPPPPKPRKGARRPVMPLFPPPPFMARPRKGAPMPFMPPMPFPPKRKPRRPGKPGRPAPSSALNKHTRLKGMFYNGY